MRARRAVGSDLPSILSIESLCFPQDIAFYDKMLYFLMRHSIALVAEEEGEVVGFVMGAMRGRWGKVITLDVHPLHQRKGVGRMLMESLEARFAALGAEGSQLEVSEINQAALALYSALGYEKGARLEDYYGPGKNAVSMWKKL
jgi:ribosomal-protein-alanine N-acetyltransferase